MIDILLILICSYVFYQLYSVLGRKPSDPEPGVQRPQQKPVSPQSKPTFTQKRSETLYASDHPQAEKILNQVDPTLTPHGFLEACGRAFAIITQAYCNGDRETLGQLVTPKLLKSFEQAINQREKLGHKEVIDELTLLKMSFDKAAIKAGKAHVCVGIESIQKRETLNAQGHYVDIEAEGSDKPIHDIWTFTHPLASDDPIWLLEQTAAVG